MLQQTKKLRYSVMENAISINNFAFSTTFNCLITNITRT
jgi:hypothetical protein